jgi:LmbE family N-acetylglucosaminyl deacetylase
MTSEKLAQIREKEQEVAAKVLGVSKVRGIPAFTQRNRPPASIATTIRYPYT